MIKSSSDVLVQIFTDELSAEMTDKKQNKIDFEADDFEAVEQAVLQTERGRWFLAEYSTRRRRSETTSLLTSMTKLEKAIRSELHLLNNSTDGFNSNQRLAYELDTLIKALGVSEESNVNPIESLAEKMAVNAFTIAQMADSIEDAIEVLTPSDLPSKSVIEIRQAAQKIITLTAQQNQLSRHVEALAKIITYLQSRLEEQAGIVYDAETEALGVTLSREIFNNLRQKVTASESDA